MAVEVGNRLVLRIEVVPRVEGRVPVELEPRPVERVGAGPGHRVDYAAGRAAELRRVGIGQYLELEHRFDAEQDARRRSRRLVVDVVDVGAVEEKAALLGTRPVDRNLRRAPADHVVAGGERGSHAGLQQRKLLEGAAVQRQLADFLVADQTAQRARGRVDDRRGAGDRHFFGDAPELELHVDDGVLTDGQSNAALRDRTETGL